MNGLLQEKNEIEKMQHEFKQLVQKNAPSPKTAAIQKEEWALEECEL